MMEGKRVVVVMPAYNASRTLERTHDEVMAHAFVDGVIVVDDASRDDTARKAKTLARTTVHVHKENRGYGANQKTCYREALKDGADIVVMIHPDYQYDSRLTPYLTGLIKDGVCDIMMGSRIRTRSEALNGGMPLYKYFFNRCLTIVENVVLGQNLGEFHSGFRAYSRRALETIPWEKNSDDFVFDQQFLIQAVYFGFRIGEVPVPARYFEEASSINFRRSVRYGLATLFSLLVYVFARFGLRAKIFVPEPCVER